MSSFLNAASGLLGGRAAQAAAAAAASLGNAVTNAVKQQTQPPPQQQPHANHHQPPPPSFRDTVLPVNAAVGRVYDSNLNPENRFDAVVQGSKPLPINNVTPFAGLPVIVGNRQRLSSSTPPPSSSSDAAVVRRYDSNLNPENQIVTPAAPRRASQVDKFSDRDSVNSSSTATNDLQNLQQAVRLNHIHTNHINSSPMPTTTSNTPTTNRQQQSKSGRQVPAAVPPHTDQPVLPHAYADESSRPARRLSPSLKQPESFAAENRNHRRPSGSNYSGNNHRNAPFPDETDANQIDTSLRKSRPSPHTARSEDATRVLPIHEAAAQSSPFIIQNQMPEIDAEYHLRTGSKKDVYRQRLDHDRIILPDSQEVSRSKNSSSPPLPHSSVRRESSAGTTTATATTATSSLFSNELSNKRLLSGNLSQTAADSNVNITPPKTDQIIVDHHHPADRLRQVSDNFEVKTSDAATVTDAARHSSSPPARKKSPSARESKRVNLQHHPRHADYAVASADSPLSAAIAATTPSTRPTRSHAQPSPPPSSLSHPTRRHHSRHRDEQLKDTETGHRPRSPVISSNDADRHKNQPKRSNSRPTSATSDQSANLFGKADAGQAPSSHHHSRQEQHQHRGRHKQLQSILLDNAADERRSQTPGGSSADGKPLSNASANTTNTAVTLINDADQSVRKTGYARSYTSHASLSPVHRRRRPPPGTVPSFVVERQHRPRGSGDDGNSPPLSTSDRRSLREYGSAELRRVGGSNYRPSSSHHHHHHSSRPHHHHHCHHRHARLAADGNYYVVPARRHKYGPPPIDIDQMARQFLLSPRSRQQRRRLVQRREPDTMSENGALQYSSPTEAVARGRRYVNKPHHHLLYEQHQLYGSEAGSGRSRDGELSLPPAPINSARQQHSQKQQQQQLMLRNRSHDDEEMSVFYERQNEYDRSHKRNFYEEHRLAGRLKRASPALEAAIASGGSSLVLEVNDAAVGGGDLLSFQVRRRALSETFGIEVRGGNDSGEIPVYISAVAVDSYADVAGLQAGDQIITINDEPCANVMTHDDAVQVIKAALVLKLDILRMSLPTPANAAARAPPATSTTKTVVLPPNSPYGHNKTKKPAQPASFSDFETSDKNQRQTMLALAPSQQPTYEQASNVGQLPDALFLTSYNQQHLNISGGFDQQNVSSPAETTQDERDAKNLLMDYILQQTQEEEEEEQTERRQHVYDEPWEEQQQQNRNFLGAQAPQAITAHNFDDQNSNYNASYLSSQLNNNNNNNNANSSEFTNQPLVSRNFDPTLILKRMTPPPPLPTSQQFYAAEQLPTKFTSSALEASRNPHQSSAAYFSDSETRYAHRSTLPHPLQHHQQPPIRQLSFPRYYKPSASPDLFATPPRLRRHMPGAMGSRGTNPLVWPNNSSSSERLNISTHNPHPVTSNVEWVLADNGRPCSPPNHTLPIEDHTVELTCDTNQKLGILIRGGGELGIFISGVEHDSAASQCGLRAGDQILAVNNEPFHGISHTRAVRVLRKCWHAVLRVSSVGKVPYARRVLRAPPPLSTIHDQQQQQQQQQQVGTTLYKTAPAKLRRSSRLSGINALLGAGGSGSTSADEAATSLSSMLSLTNTDDSTLHWLGSITDRADVVLTNSAPASKDQLIFHINEYVRGASTLDMLMLALFDVLDTPYKLELLYDVKNIIRPKDLSRFDALSHTMRLDWLRPATNTLASNILPGPTEFAPVSAILDEAFQLRIGGPATSSYLESFPQQRQQQHQQHLGWPPPPSLSIQPPQHHHQHQQHPMPPPGVGGGGGGLQIPFKYCSFPPPDNNNNNCATTSMSMNAGNYLWNSKQPLSAVMEETEGMMDPYSQFNYLWPHQQQQQQQQQQFVEGNNGRSAMLMDENDATPQAMPLTPLYINEPRDFNSGQIQDEQTFDNRQQQQQQQRQKSQFTHHTPSRAAQSATTNAAPPPTRQQRGNPPLASQLTNNTDEKLLQQPAPFLHSHSDSQAMQTYIKSAGNTSQQKNTLSKQPSLSLENVPEVEQQQQQQQQQRVRFQSDTNKQQTLAVPGSGSLLQRRLSSSSNRAVAGEQQAKQSSSTLSISDPTVIYAEPYQGQESNKPTTDSAAGEQPQWFYPPAPPGSGASNPQYSQQSLSPYQFYHQPPPPPSMMMDENQLQQAWQHYAQLSGQAMSISPYGQMPPNPYDPSGSGVYQTSPNFMQPYPEEGSNMRPNSLAFNKMPKKMLKTVEPTKEETVVVKKLAPYLGIAIEGGKDTKQPLPRVINIQRDGCAHLAGRLRVGHVIKSVNGTSLQGLSHSEAVQLITRLFSDASVVDLKFVVQEVNRLPST